MRYRDTSSMQCRRVWTDAKYTIINSMHLLRGWTGVQGRSQAERRSNLHPGDRHRTNSMLGRPWCFNAQRVVIMCFVCWRGAARVCPLPPVWLIADLKAIVAWLTSITSFFPCLSLAGRKPSSAATDRTNLRKGINGREIWQRE